MKRVFAFIGFSFAITLLVINIIPFAAVRYITLVLSVLVVLSFAIKKIRQARVLPVILCSCTLACLLFSFVYSNYTLPQLALDNTEANASIVLTSVGEEKSSGSYYLYDARLDEIDDKPCDIKVVLVAYQQLNAEPYDKLNAKVKLAKTGDSAFSSNGYFSDNIFLKAVIKGNYTVTESDEMKPIGYYVVKLTQSVKGALYTNLDGDLGALAVSILTGDKSQLSDDIYDDFCSCGISHTIAVSGLHTTIICMSFYFVLKMLKTPRAFSTILTIVLTAVYISVVGGTRSAIRAGVALSVMLISKLFSRNADSLNSLGIATFLICLNPYAVSDVGALLSVSAVLGILIILPKLSSFEGSLPKWLQYIKNSAVFTFSITIATLPVLCIFFSSISLVGLILNIVIIPILYCALISALLLVLFSGVHFLAFVPKCAATLLLNLMIYLADAFASELNWLSINNWDNYLLISVAFCFIFLGCVLLVNKTLSSRLVPLIMSIILVTSLAFSVYDYNTTVTVQCLKSGGIIAYDADTILIVDDVKNAYYYLGVSENSKKQFVFVLLDVNDCKDFKEYDNNIVLGGENIPLNRLDSRLTVEKVNGEFNIRIFDNCFKLTEKDVIINDIRLDKSQLYEEQNAFTFYFKEHSEVRYTNG